MVADRSRLAVRSAVVAYAAATVLLALVTTLQPGTPEARQLILNSAFLVGTATLFTACVARVARRSGRDRRGWLFLGLSTSWLVGNCWWFWYQELAPSQPYPSWSDVSYLAALGFCAAIVSTYLPRAIDRRTKVRLVLDGLLVALGLLTLLYLLYLEAALQSMSSTSLLAVMVSTAYPLTEITLLTLVLLALRHGRGRDRSLRLLGRAWRLTSPPTSGGTTKPCTADTFPVLHPSTWLGCWRTA